MSNDLLEKPSRGSEYDDNASWYKGSGSKDPKGDDLDAAYNSPSASDDDLPESHPSKKKKQYDGDELGEQEGNTNRNDANGSTFGSRLSKESLYSGRALGAAMASGRMGAMGRLRFIMSTRRGKAGGAGGLIITGILIFFALSATTLELHHIKENVLNNSATGRLQALVAGKRRARHVNKLAKKTGGYATRKTVNAVKLETKLNRAGIQLQRAADGTVTQLTKNGEDVTNIISRGGDDLLKLSDDLDEVLKTADSLYAGPAARNVLKVRFGGLVSWLKGGAQEGESAKKAVKRQMDSADDVAEKNIQRQLASNADDALIAGTTEAERAAGATIDDLTTGVVDNAVAGVADDTVRAAEKAADDVGTKVTEATAKRGALTLDNLVDDVLPILAKESPSLFGKLAAGAARGISLTEPIRVGCTIRGTINFFSSIRNVQLAKLAATGFLRFLTAESEQKANVEIRSSATNMFMTALHADGGYMSSGAFQAKIGVPGAQASSKERGLYSNARAPTGVLGTLANIVNAIPGVNNPGVCRFAHNGLVIVGSIALGAVVGFFSGGSTTAATGSLSLGLTFAQIVVEVVGVPLFARYLENRASAAFSEGGSWGPTIAGGGSALQGSFGGAAAMTPSTQVQVNKLKKEEQFARAYRRSKESVFDRYLNIAKSDSLLGQLAFATPKTPAAAADATSSLALNFSETFSTGGISAVMGLTGINSKMAYAANNSECYEDSQLKDHNIALSEDGLCYPVQATAPDIPIDDSERILLQLGEIDGTGLIVSDAYKKYVENCFTGRSGILYTAEIDKDGKNDPRDNTCVDPGPAVAGSPYGLNVHRQNYYGMVVDMDALTEGINDEYETAAGEETATGTTNNNLFVLGDSLTVGMQSLGGSVSTRNYLEEQLKTKGWNTTVNAQGCRGVYQPNGPIEGNGTSCPRGSIVDGLTVVNDINQPLYDSLKNSGTYVIGLGTNRTERLASATDDSLFKQKAIELIDRIRSSEVSPNATIYWVNLSLQNKTNEAERNRIISELVAEKNIRLIDWAAHVTATNSNPSTTDDVTFADAVHHDAEGYRKKVAFVVEALGQAPAGSFSSNTSFSCTGYKEIGTGPTNILNRTYSAKIQSVCADMQRQCAAGVDDTRRILCAAFEFDGVYYGNGYSETYAGAKAIPIYGFNANGGNYGLNPTRWINERQPGLHPKNLLECSGLAAVALYKAYNFSSGSLYCSGQFTERQNPALFDQMTAEQIKPGDFLTLSFGCNNGGSGHVAIAASTPDANGNIIVYETNAWKRPVRFTEKNLQKDFPGGWSRFKPQTGQ